MMQVIRVKFFKIFSAIIFLGVVAFLLCFDIYIELSQREESIVLENFMSASEQPENGQNIFFVDTTRMKRHFRERNFTSRQACAIESAGKV